MKKLVIIICFPVILLAESYYVPGELILKFFSNVRINPIENKEQSIFLTGINSIDQLNTKFSCNSIEKGYWSFLPSTQNFYLFIFPKNSDLMAIKKEYEADPNVEYAELNYIGKTCLEPNDPYFTLQWSHDNLHLCSAKAWDITTGSLDISIGIMYPFGEVHL